ncbi:MAG: 4Fe-4S dicluster domain-containing protein [Clostridiales bacterium]
MKNSGVLCDITKCIGCGSCTVACKLWNDLDYTKGNAHGFDTKLSEETWTTVQYYETKNPKGQDVLRFAKHQCMHCIDPSCVSVCFADAITVNEDGAVVYNAKKCVGCRYCMIACPYDVPKYEWDKTFPSVIKCQLCSEKLAEGSSPSCTMACPTGALTYGDRDELLAKAKGIIAKDSSYINSVYGETQGGGTRWLYISDVPFKDLGFKEHIPTTSIPERIHEYSKWKPGIFIGGAVFFGALGLYTKRRVKRAEEEAKEDGGDDNV